MPQDADADNLAHTESGTVRARHLLIAGGALLGRLVPALARKLMAVGTYIAATEPLGEERARALITNNAAAADMNWMLDYFRRSADHRLLFGGRVSYSGRRSVRFRARAARPHRPRVPATRTRASNTPGAATSTSRRTARRTSDASGRTPSSCRGSPATAW